MNTPRRTIWDVRRELASKGPKRSKYGNVRTEYNGQTYMSAKEARYAAELDLLKNAVNLDERVLSYETQVPYDMVVNGVKICRYVLDFRVNYGSGRIAYVDVKGMRTDVYKLKKKMMKAFHGIEIEEV